VTFSSAVAACHAAPARCLSASDCYYKTALLTTPKNGSARIWAWQPSSLYPSFVERFSTRFAYMYKAHNAKLPRLCNTGADVALYAWCHGRRGVAAAGGAFLRLCWEGRGRKGKAHDCIGCGGRWDVAVLFAAGDIGLRAPRCLRHYLYIATKTSVCHYRLR